MKLWHSVLKELLLSSRSFYFYIEIIMAAVFLVLLVFVIPENFEVKTKEYIYLDIPESSAARDFILEEFINSDEDGVPETVELELDDQMVSAVLYETEISKLYLIDSEEAVIQFADEERELGAVIQVNDQGEIAYTYYLQGYETERVQNILLALHNQDIKTLIEYFDAQDVRVLETEHVLLTDRENVIPSFLTFNGSLMGLFIIASYIFLDKKEGVIKAYAVTASSVWQYLLSKMIVIMLISTLTSLIIVVPVMGLRPNYPLMVLFLVTTGFAASALGLVLTSYYDDITQAFGVLYFLILALMLPNIAYFIPSWNPTWMTYFPTYPMLEGFKELMLLNGDISYVLTASLGFLAAGLILFFFANLRFKKTLTV